MKRILAAGIVLAALSSSATALASADAATHHALPSAKARAFQVTATVNKTEPLLDSKIKIKATVKPAAPGAAVTLQVKYDGRKSWKTIGHKRLSAASRVTFKDKAGSVRSRVYRVVKPADSRHGAGSGKAPKVTVYGWRALTSIEAVSSMAMFEGGSVSINGTAYPNSITGSPTSQRPDRLQPQP